MARMFGAYAGGRAWGSARFRVLARRIALAVLARLADRPRLDDHQRAWLVEDSKQYLEALREDIEAGGVGIETARLATTVGAMLLWLEGRGASPGRAGIEYLGKNLATIYRRPTEDELFQRGAYLAAIGELGGDEEAVSAIWRRPVELGDPDELARVTAFQGRKLRALMRERGMSIARLAERSEIEEVLLISMLFGIEEMRFEEAVRLAGALDVEPAYFSEGIRFLPNPDGTGSGLIEIDLGLDVPDQEDDLPLPTEPRERAGRDGRGA